MNLEKAYVIDIETTDLLANMLDYSSFPYKLNTSAALHVVVIRNIGTNTVFKAEQGEITREWMQETLRDCEYLIQHNGVKFDLITLKLFGVLDYTIGYPGEEDTLFGRPVRMVDTLIISRILNPDRWGGHSLEAWGERTGYQKMAFRQRLIDMGALDASSPKGAEFKEFHPLMTEYCIDDTEVGKNTFLALMQEIGDYKGWGQAIKMEHKLADLAIRRESLGFWFDRDLAIKCVADLSEKMEELRSKVNPILPPKPMTKGELAEFTPPKTQLKKNGTPGAHITNFAQKIGATLIEESGIYSLDYEGKKYKLPCNIPVKTHIEADISDLDHVKTTLINDYGWDPIEWAERDFTKDSKKVSLPYDKRIIAFERWVKETCQGKYKEHRLKIAFENYRVSSVYQLEEAIREKLYSDFPVRLPTSPKVRVGVEKELCPNLIKLGDKVEFAGDFALYLTYKHRKSSIAGGPIEDIDLDLEYPNTGYLSFYREADGRIPTPAIEIGSNSHRYRHIGVANIPRATSVYGKEMRSLFGSGPDFFQIGYDFAALESRVMGHYVMKYEHGEELAKAMIAEKPFDVHSVNSRKLGIPRDTVKSLTYALLYGAQIKKLMKMLSVSKEEATRLFNEYWESVPALKELRDNVVKFWAENGKTFVPGIDGRKVMTRSPHSLLNAIFQSCGVIIAKYVNVLTVKRLEKEGLNIDPFIGKPDICNMIEYHDELQAAIRKDLVKFKVFDTEEEAKKFVEDWKENQLSAIGHASKWYVVLPNPVSIAVADSIKEVESLFNLKVPIGYEWIVGRSWYECH